MAFSFGFDNDDIDDSMQIDGVEFEKSEPFSTLNGASTKDPLAGLAPEYHPAKHDLASLLRQSTGVRASYTDVYLSPNGSVYEESTGQDSEIKLPRRDLYDVKHQLMLQDKLSPADEVLMGSTNEDLRAAQYEGGLKSWECTYDLVGYLSKNIPKTEKVMELGCGTGIPSIYTLQQRLLSNRKSEAKDPLKLILCDYNESVLRLVTAPNMLFAWLETFESEERLQILIRTSEGSDAIAEARLGEVEITDKLIDEFLVGLEKEKVNIQFVSGAWSPKFVDIAMKDVLKGSKADIILASETVYSLETIPVFTDTTIDLLDTKGTALVAAKNVYFGVGGGLLEFETDLKRHPDIQYNVVSSTTGTGVARSIVEIKYC